VLVEVASEIAFGNYVLLVNSSRSFPCKNTFSWLKMKIDFGAFRELSAVFF